MKNQAKLDYVCPDFEVIAVNIEHGFTISDGIDGGDLED